MSSMLPEGFKHYNVHIPRPIGFVLIKLTVCLRGQDILNDIDSRFTVKALKTMCSSCGLTVSGTKPMLQYRLRTHFLQLSQRNNLDSFHVAKAAAEHERGYPYGGVPPRAAHRYIAREEIID
jgi:hypothetical protein